MTFSQHLGHVNCGLGVLLNLLLLYLIRRFSRIELGTYKYLLDVFSGYDLFLSILHFVVNPKTLRVNSTYGTVAHSYVESAHLLSFYYSCFSMSFALLNVHFLYRFWIIKHADLVENFTKPKFIALLTAYFVILYIIWHNLAMSAAPEPDDQSLPVVRAAFYDLYNMTVHDGWLILDHWRDGRFNYHTLWGLVPSTVIMMIQFNVAAYLAWGAYRAIAAAESISTASKKFQIKILKSVCAQARMFGITFVPVVFVYLPYSCIFYFPLLGIPDCGLSVAFPVLVSFFPAWDAIVITSLIKDYREGVLKLFCIKSAKKTNVTVPSFTASSEMSTRWAENVE